MSRLRASRHLEVFRRPAPGVYPLAADVQACMHVEERTAYVIEERTPAGVWLLHSAYGSDEALALSRARWWAALCRGRRQFRVCAVLRDSSFVVMGEGAGHA